MQTPPKGTVTIEGGVYAGKGVGWPAGLDSFSNPLYTNELQLRWLENAVIQGAFVQTRFGNKLRVTFDPTVEGSAANQWWQDVEGPIVHPQMMVRFRPTTGAEQLVFAISGSVFFCIISPYGELSTPQWITTLRFNKNADQLVAVPCIQSATIIGGLYANNIAPRNLLIIQDGANRAGIWDGFTGVHANPEKRIVVDSEGGTLYPEAWNQTRVGLWMAWSGNRLWIANGPNVYASDLNDPTHFTEELNLQSVPVFTFEDDVTGMVDRGTSGTSRSQVVVFTNYTTETLWSGVQNRLPAEGLGPGWQYTSDFRVKIFDAVGCVAGKSIIIHRGLLYWKSAGGIVLFDSTQTVNSSQNLPPIDQEMAYSKMRVSPPNQGADLTCAGRNGGFVFWSVPVGKSTHGRIYNGQTQVLNRQTNVVRSVGTGGAFQAGTTGWNGVWTGIRPVQWANARAGGQEVTYALSISSTGAIHIWQAFQANRSDNGHRVPWIVETRTHPVQPTIFEYATFSSFELLLDQIYGNVSVVGYWRGTRGTYHELLTTNITATPGSIFTPQAQFSPMVYGTDTASFGVQSRHVKSRQYKGALEGECQSRNVESEYSDATDVAFSLSIRITGRAALTAYTFEASTQTQPFGGNAKTATGVDENGFNIVPQGGCPEHISGTTPDYVANDIQQQLSASPYQPGALSSLGDDYESPVS